MLIKITMKENINYVIKYSNIYTTYIETLFSKTINQYGLNYLKI